MKAHIEIIIGGDTHNITSERYLNQGGKVCYIKNNTIVLETISINIDEVNSSINKIGRMIAKEIKQHL